MKLRASRVLKRLRAGEVASCIKLNLADARVAEIAALCGFDCVWSDLEHVPNSIRDIEHQARAAKVHDADLMVRVERGSYSDLIRPLEVDAAGLMVPHVMSAEDAREIVRQTRFHPLGRRPMDGGNSDGAYTLAPIEEYVRSGNHERFIMVQIEDPEAMEALDAIAAVQGIDLLFFGPADYSHGLGIPGRLDDPRVQEARRRVADAARRHGKYAGTIGSIPTLRQCLSEGFRFVSLGADVAELAARWRSVVEEFRTIVEDKAEGEDSTQTASGGTSC